MKPQIIKEEERIPDKCMDCGELVEDPSPEQIVIQQTVTFMGNGSYRTSGKETFVRCKKCTD